MCNLWPGTRCYTDTNDVYEDKIKKADKIKGKFGEDSYEYKIASAHVEVALKKRDATKEGIAQLVKRIENENDVRDLRARLAVAERTYKMQTNAFLEVKNGRAELIGVLAPNPDGYFTENELKTIVGSEREYKERSAQRYNSQVGNKTTDRAYATFCDDIEYRLKKQHNGIIPEDKLEALAQLRTMSPPDSVNFGAYKDIERAVQKSKEALQSEISKVAALQGVDKLTAESFYDGYRRQYIKEFAELPKTDQPNPPKSWVRGEFGHAGYKNDFTSNFAPNDPASLYAIYRLRSDSNAIPEKYKTHLDVASIDLETAGPEGPDGLRPEKGRIIEVGVVSYDAKTNKETGRYSQLIRPESLFLKRHGTGAMHVHQITPEDLAEKPAWETVKDDTRKALEGKVLLAQNARFEKSWLAYHGDPIFIGSLPIVDTLDMARKHLDIPDHKLSSICANVGVAYTDGHRATHDARVTGEAYFSLIKHIERIWKKKPSRANAPALKSLPKLSRIL